MPIRRRAMDTNTDNELPPIKEQARNLFTDLSKAIAKSVKNGKVLAAKEEIERRLEICVQCDMYNAKKKRCSKCGCWTNKKVLLENIDCPLAKWGKEK